MLKKLQKKSEGFTIIEVMIVLAIAGLILLIVFLAVPALQRNSRNTQRKSEASAIASAYSEYVNNHGGNPPTTGTQIANNVKLSFYTTGVPNPIVLASTATTLGTAPDTDNVAVFVHAKCDATKDYSAGAANAANQVTYSSRGGVVVFTTEGGGGTDTPTCISAN
jgi:prepilin-type N-terminal cleavage/methylation domain-containing protein